MSVSSFAPSLYTFFHIYLLKKNEQRELKDKRLHPNQLVGEGVMKRSVIQNKLCIFIATLHRERTVQRAKLKKKGRKKENIIRNKVNKEQMFIKQCYSSKEINSENKLLGFVT